MRLDSNTESKSLNNKAAVSLFHSVGSITRRIDLETEGTGLGTSFIAQECFVVFQFVDSCDSCDSCAWGKGVGVPGSTPVLGGVALRQFV